MNSGRVKIQATIARPIKIAGRVVLGPRLVGQRYARIIALANGAGLIEIYDTAAGVWRAAPESCDFGSVWRAAAAPLTFAAQTAADTPKVRSTPAAPSGLDKVARNPG
jgi:hypothetical protein